MTLMQCYAAMRDKPTGGIRKVDADEAESIAATRAEEKAAWLRRMGCPA